MTQKKTLRKRSRAKRGGRKGRRTKSMIQIAKERMDILFNLADQEAVKHNLQRANRYVDLARKIGMRYNVRIESKHQRKFCKYCYSYLMPGISARARTRDAKLTVLCIVCGKYNRYPFYREVRNKRKFNYPSEVSTKQV